MAAQTENQFETATVAPADALAYAVVPLDPDAAQWTQTLRLLDRAGLGSTVERLQDEAPGDGSDDPLLLELFLGGELAVVVMDTAAELLISETLRASGFATGDPGSESTDTFSDVTESGFAAVITADSPDFIAASVRTAISDTAASTGVEVQTTEHEGIEVEYVEVAVGSDETPLATARVDDFVLVAGFPVDLEPLIETSQGIREPLTSLDEFNQVQAALVEEHLAFGFINPFPSDDLRASLGEAGLPVGYIGGQSVPTGFLLAADEVGLRLETVAIGSGGTASATTLTDSSLLTQAPGDALAFMAGLDLASTGVLDLIGAFVLTASGLVAPDMSARSLDEQLEAQFSALAQNFGVNPRSEILQQLSGAYGLWFGLDETNGAVSALFASGVDDVRTVAGALAQITLIVQSGGSGELTIVTRPVGDDARVYQIETGDSTIPRVEYGVVDDELVVGLGDAVDNVDQNPESSLADNERFQAIMSVLPEPTAGLVYIDLEQVIPIMSAAADEADVEALTDDIEGMPDQDDGDNSGEGIAATATTGDASPDCASYDSQEDAQAAYDAFEAGTFRLDQDFDGVACEDFFGTATPSAPPGTDTTEQPVGEPDQVEPAADAISAVTAFGLVAYDEDGNSRTSSLLVIAEPDD
ncbi:MAG: DUF3352 domain-containing protein [Chloroflexota bacterium]|nr:DUF3352 domain-containing protein [Chloroflexota bacterium]